MRDKPTDRVEAGRLIDRDWDSPFGVIWGAFRVLGPCGRHLLIISSDGSYKHDEGHGWEHVSVSTDRYKPPNWEEMNWVKEQFWKDEETVLQFHPMKSEYKNVHPGCLHLWRNVGFNHPLPPQIVV
jgi:hypothetical protein